MSGNDYWYPFYPVLYQNNTMHLTLEQDAIYRRLIDHYMLTQEPILLNETVICRIVGCTPDAWSNAWCMLNAFFEEIDGYLHHEFCNNLLDEQSKRQKKRSSIAKKAAAKRWNKKKKPKMRQASIEHASSNANAMHKNATGKESIYKKDISKDISKKVENDDLKTAYDLYNETAKKCSLPIAQKFTATRKSKLKKRLKDCGGLDGWKAAMQKIENSKFLTGDNREGWKADLDFILQESSFVKIMEGKYDDNTSAKPNGKSRSQDLAEQAERLLDKYSDPGPNQSDDDLLL